MRHLQTCRFCKLSNFESPEALVKYGPRHNAHLSCGLNKFGEPFLDRLSLTALQQLPALVLDRYHLLGAVRQRLAALEARYAR